MEDKTPRTLSFIPFDLVTSHVLPRLPAKTLVRFSAVCKSWYSLIRNPDFVNSHLRLNLSKPTLPCFLCTSNCDRWFIASENPNGGKPVVHNLGFERGILHLIGSCKGLISLSIRNGIGEGIILYNPSIRMIKLVKKFPRGNSSYHLYRFGYDEQSNDHRLLKVTCKYSWRLSRNSWHKVQKAEVYSLTTSSWQKIQQVLPGMLEFLGNYLYGARSAIYLNGATYWLTYVQSKDNTNDTNVRASIVSFDFNQEIFREVMLPGELQVNDDTTDDIFKMHISEFEGSVALLFHGNIWVLREDDVVESSWKKTYQLHFPPAHVPRALLRDGTVVLQKPSGKEFEQPEMVFYGLENRKVKDFGKFYDLYRVDDFTESLLLFGLDKVKYDYPDRFFEWNW